MTDDILDRLRAPHGYFGRLMRCQAADEIARLREALSDEEYVSKDTNEMFHEVRDELNISLLVNDKLRARIAELEALLSQTNEGYAECIATREDYRARISELEAAIESFSSEAGKYPDLHDTYLVLVPLADLRAARTAYLGENK